MIYKFFADTIFPRPPPANAWWTPNLLPSQLGRSGGERRVGPGWRQGLSATAKPGEPVKRRAV